MGERVLKRLEALEKLSKQKHLIVLCRLPTGQLKELTAAECVEQNAEFIRVVSGDCLEDVDILLKAAYEEAGRIYEAGNH